MSRISLYNGNCLEIIPKLAAEGVKVNAVITDLPYGTTACDWDSVIPFEPMWKCINSIKNENTAICLFGNEPFSSALRKSNLKEYRYDIYWQKERATNIFQLKKRPAKVIENVSVFYSKQPTYNPQMVKYEGPLRTNKVKNGKLGTLVDSSGKKPNEYKDNGLRYPLQIVQFKRDILTSNLHPTQKPVALMEWIVKTYTNEGDVVIDFTMGSGTTGVACKNLNRDFIGVEINEEYFKIAKERIGE